MPLPAPVRAAPPRQPQQQPRAPPPQQAQPTQPQQQQQQPRRAPAPQQPRAPAVQYAAPPQQAPQAPVAAAATAPVASAASSSSGGGKGFSFPSLSGVFGKSSAPAEPLDEAALREANLRAREEKMLAKEMEVEARERQVRLAEGKAKNWPSKCAPLLYHSIADEIPQRLQPMMKRFYATVLVTWLSLLWNMITVITVWGETDSDQGTILCVFFFIVGVPGSWGWYQRVYKAARNSSSRQYLFFFVAFFFHCGMMLLIGLGTPTMGAGGLFVMLKAYGGGYPVSGTFALIVTALFLLNFTFSLYLYKLARDAWRSGGGSEALEKDRAKLKLAGKAGLATV